MRIISNISRISRTFAPAYVAYVRPVEAIQAESNHIEALLTLIGEMATEVTPAVPNVDPRLARGGLVWF
jgi:hypothetical protein